VRRLLLYAWDFLLCLWERFLLFSLRSFSGRRASSLLSSSSVALHAFQSFYCLLYFIFLEATAFSFFDIVRAFFIAFFRWWDSSRVILHEFSAFILLRQAWFSHWSQAPDVSFFCLQFIFFESFQSFTPFSSFERSSRYASFFFFEPFTLFIYCFLLFAFLSAVSAAWDGLLPL